MGYWSAEALSKINDVVGKPLYTDKVTVGMERISYARVLIETNVSKVLPESIELIMPSGAIQQRITYEWKPKFCNDYFKLDHEDVNSWKKVQEQPVEGQVQKGLSRRRRKNKLPIQEWRTVLEE